MEYIINSTLSTFVGSLVIGIWLSIGYGIIRLWCYFSGNVFRLSFKTIVGIWGGLFTAPCMLAVGIYKLLPDNFFD